MSRDIALSVRGDASDGITIDVYRGAGLARRSVLITPDLLLSFGGESHTADACDLVRAVVGEVNLALGEIQGGTQ